MDEFLNMFNLSPVSSTLFFCYFFPPSLSLKICFTLSLFKQPKTFKVVLCTERLAFLQNYWRAMQSQDPLWTLPWAAEQVKQKLLGMLTNRHTSSLEGIGRHLLFRSPLRDMLTLTGQAVENHTSSQVMMIYYLSPRGIASWAIFCTRAIYHTEMSQSAVW